MTSFLDLVKTRQSVRSYLDKPVEEEKLQRILEAARLAPSACNAQPWKLIVVDDYEKRMAIAEASSSRILPINHFVRQAPIQIVIVEERENFIAKLGGYARNKHYPPIDIGIVAAHICLAATDEGLGSCIIGWHDEKKIKKILDIPNGKRVMVIILLGYSKQPLRTKHRKSLSEVVSYNKY